MDECVCVCLRTPPCAYCSTGFTAVHRLPRWRCRAPDAAAWFCEGATRPGGLRKRGVLTHAEGACGVCEYTWLACNAPVYVRAHWAHPLFMRRMLRAAQDVSVWDITVHAWVPQHGVFGVFVGASSRDIRLSGGMVV